MAIGQHTQAIAAHKYAAQPACLAEFVLEVALTAHKAGGAVATSSVPQSRAPALVLSERLQAFIEELVIKVLEHALLLNAVLCGGAASGVEGGGGGEGGDGGGGEG